MALIGLSIAGNQYRTSHNKLRLDLFEKRYAVYRGLADLFAAVINHRLTEAEIGKFFETTDAKRFLFGEEVERYMETAWKNAEAILHFQQVTDPSKHAGPSMIEKARVDCEIARKWFAEQTPVLSKPFQRYLGFRSILDGTT